MLAVLDQFGRLALVGRAQRAQGRFRQIARRDVAVVGVFGHAARDDVVERRRDGGIALAGARDGFDQVGSHQRAQAGGLERPCAREAFEKEAGQSVDVDPVGGVVVAESLGAM